MEKYILVEYLSSSNNAIPETFKSIQRIKLISFDVCNNYLIFGANSGGVYIFKRHPYEFLKLIPSKEGAAKRISISSNEKHLAVASSSGVVIILEDFITDVNVGPLMYYEHEGHVVEAMKWHGNNVYCGDDIGKISVCTLTSLLTKTIFQTPSAVLMHLDGAVVQIDAYNNYLLVSTRTRTYLCDTEREQYKQIGKKLRDGNFGACFLNNDNTEFVGTEEKTVGIFRTVKEDEQFLSDVIDNKSKIYCARPGVRLWEANFEPTVLVTHQFRDSLKQSISELLIIEDNCDAKLSISDCDDVNFPKSFNFETLFPMNQRFIFTYNQNGIYCFDLMSSQLAFWTNIFSDAKDVKVLNNYIYIWRKDLRISIVALQSLEELILTTLLRKQYFLCAQICVRYCTDVASLIETSNKIHLISVLKTILCENGGTNLLEQLSTLFDKLEEYKKKYFGQKLDKCIVFVENGVVPTSDSDEYIPESVQNFKEPKSQKGSRQDKNLQILYKQYILNKSHSFAELTETNKLLQSLNLNEIVLIFENFIEYVQQKHNEDATEWCRVQIIKRASKECIDSSSLEQKTLNYLDESYLGINQFQDLNCKCKFPLPSAHKVKPTYYALGCRLMDQANKDNEYLYHIPYLYKHILNRVTDLANLILQLPKIVQFSDKTVFKQCTQKFTYDTWDELLKLFIRLKQGCCLNCGGKIDVHGSISWQQFALLMLESVGPKNTCRLLRRYTGHIPNGELDGNFYQSCILASVYDDPQTVMNFMETVGNSNAKFEESMGKFIQKEYFGKELISDFPVMNIDTGTCKFCMLPLTGPILTETKKTACEHVFHSLCFSHNNGICNIYCGVISQKNQENIPVDLVKETFPYLQQTKY